MFCLFPPRHQSSRKHNPEFPDTRLTREATGLLHQFSTPNSSTTLDRVFFWANELETTEEGRRSMLRLFVCAATS